MSMLGYSCLVCLLCFSCSKFHIRMLACANHPKVCLWLFFVLWFLWACFVSLYQIVGSGSLNLEPNLYYVSVYGFSLLLLILREEEGRKSQKIVYSKLKYSPCYISLIWRDSNTFYSDETFWDPLGCDVCCVFCFPRKDCFWGKLKRRKVKLFGRVRKELQFDKISSHLKSILLISR